MKQFGSMTPSGRGAFAASEGPVFGLYDEAPREEALRVNQLVIDMEQSLERVLTDYGGTEHYIDQLRSLVNPLGLPALTDTLKVVDAMRWGLHTTLSEAGTIQGPFRDTLESAALKGLTDLGPADLARESPARIRRRIKRKIAPLGRHINRYDLAGRIGLWVLHVVYGEHQHSIASRLQEEGEVLPDRDPLGWIKKQIGEASQILGASRRGRPRKWGVLRHWKLMAE